MTIKNIKSDFYPAPLNIDTELFDVIAEIIVHDIMRAESNKSREKADD